MVERTFQVKDVSFTRAQRKSTCKSRRDGMDPADYGPKSDSQKVLEQGGHRVKCFQN